MIGQRRALRGVGQFEQQFFDELEQVVHLLELAPGVLVELALAREDVQLLQQLDRLAGAHLGRQFGTGGSRAFFHGVGPTSSFFQPSGPSFSIVTMLAS